MAWMTTWPENSWFFPEDGQRGSSPTGSTRASPSACATPWPRRPRERSDLLATFAYRTQAAGLLPCLFSVTQETADHAAGRRWRTVQVAEEAVIDLPSLRFTGKAWQDVRTALNQAAKQGLTHRLVPLAQQPRGVQVQVRAISEQWVGDKGLPEMGFTLGGLDEAMDPEVRVGLAIDADGTVHGVTSWMPAYGPDGTTAGLDARRHAPAARTASATRWSSSSPRPAWPSRRRTPSSSPCPGCRSPVRARAPTDPDRGVLDAFLDTLGARLEPYYGFRSLQAFKSKFQPSHTPLYLVFPDEAALPRIGLALSRAYLPEAGVRDLISLAHPRRQLVKT